MTVTETSLLSGRILFLSADPGSVRRQLAGEVLCLAECAPLRDDISTDEITPVPSLVVFDERLGQHAHIGFESRGERPISLGAIAEGGFFGLVGGKRYGKGSSREHSPLAERAAGIQLVIAESFERIYRQNADNVGLFTSTDFGLLHRLRVGEPIDIEDLLIDRDPIAAAILRAGGLLAYGHARLSAIELVPVGDDGRPRTLFEKILLRHAVATTDCATVTELGQSGFVRADMRFIHDIYTAMCRHILGKAFGAVPVLYDPASITVFEDHYSYTHLSHAHRHLMPHVRALSAAHRAFVSEHGLRHHGYLETGVGSEGISHALVAEMYAMPGELIVGTDSHTPHSGALGCVAFAAGTTDIANAFVTGAVRIVMPDSIRVELTGTCPGSVTAKDIALHLLALPALRAGAGVGRAFEFTGAGVHALSTDERATLTNMTAELGGFTGLIAPDEETVRFVRERRGQDIVLEEWMRTDTEATYALRIDVDLSQLSPMVAKPGDPGNGMEVGALNVPIQIDIAYGGSCTAGKRKDFDYYHEVLSWAARHGRTVAPDVKLYLQFGTVDVRDYCIRQGYLEAFAATGVELLQPACGACANCGPGASEHPDQVTISAINRNFSGRSGPGQVWLASPYTVAASALVGRIIGFDELKRMWSEAPPP